MEDGRAQYREAAEEQAERPQVQERPRCSPERQVHVFEQRRGPRREAGDREYPQQRDRGRYEVADDELPAAHRVAQQDVYRAALLRPRYSARKGQDREERQRQRKYEAE